MVSSAGAPGYALGYPERLQEESARLTAHQQQAAELAHGFDDRMGDFKPGAEPALLRVIVRQADDAGRSEAYAAAFDEARGLNAFWDEARGPITARVNGAAQKRLSNAGCAEQTDLGGPIGYALNDGIEKQLEKRLHARNEAHATIETQKSALGPANVAAAERLADHVALSSYLTNIALVEERDRIRSLLAERSDVEATLANAIEWERSYRQGDRGPAEKKASAAREAALDASRAAIPAAASQAENALENLDPKIEHAREQHEIAVAKLDQDLEDQDLENQERRTQASAQAQ